MRELIEEREDASSPSGVMLNWRKHLYLALDAEITTSLCLFKVAFTDQWDKCLAEVPNPRYNHFSREVAVIPNVNARSSR